MDLKPGSRWKSAVCTAEVVIVRPPRSPALLECGGHPVTPIAAERREGLAPLAGHAGGIQMGKRYVDEATAMEVLVSKAGQGSLSLNGSPLQLKEAKALPSSD